MNPPPQEFPCVFAPPSSLPGSLSSFRSRSTVIDPALTAAIAARDKAAIARDGGRVARYTAEDYIAVNRTAC